MANFNREVLKYLLASGFRCSEEEGMRIQLSPCRNTPFPGNQYEFFHYQTLSLLSRQLKTILWMPKINYCWVWATVNGSPLPTANRYTPSGPLQNLSYSQKLHFSVILSIAPAEMHGWKQTEVTQNRDATFQQKECLLQDVFGKDVLFETRKTTSELFTIASLRFHLAECAGVYVMGVGWEVFWNI